ncbi:MAG: hypothetical protein KatS3mg068_2640 [Candidatus Sericytochromatia bacterium]|nr:MAG: hypothetical protein KatS3mg068_2640 [Candidatus Sericytochromatia bacterium]
MLLWFRPVLWGKDNKNHYPMGFLANAMIESEESEVKDQQEDQQTSIEEENSNNENTENQASEEQQKEVTQQESQNQQNQNVKKTLDECIQSLESQDVGEQILALNTCAKEYVKEEKLQESLLKLLNDSNNSTVLTSSLLLLSNQKKDKISNGLIELIQNGKFQNDSVLSYASTVVLYSNITDNTKEKAKEIFQNLVNSEDELLKNLAENLLKKN